MRNPKKGGDIASPEAKRRKRKELQKNETFEEREAHMRIKRSKIRAARSKETKDQRS